MLNNNTVWNLKGKNRIIVAQCLMYLWLFTFLIEADATF